MRYSNSSLADLVEASNIFCCSTLSLPRGLVIFFDFGNHLNDHTEQSNNGHAIESRSKRGPDARQLGDEGANVPRDSDTDLLTNQSK